MSVDLSQFHQVFFEECFEGLEVMETGLLELDPAAIDNETVNAIFRAAHSIKGGSATFSFTAVSEFTHVLETLLDQVRDGSRSISQDEIDLFLESVDCLRGLVESLQAETEVDTTHSSELIQRFEAILNSDGSGVAAETINVPEAEQAGSGWRVQFNPEPQILATGNEPLRMFGLLRELGDLKVMTATEQLPDFGTMQVESCYLSWTLELTNTDASREQISEIFEWVEDDAEIIIEPLVATATPQASAPDEASTDEQTDPVEMPDTAAAPPEVEANKAVAAAAKSKAPKAEAGSIRVDIDKIDTMINMVGELVITQSMLGQIGDEFTADKLPKLQAGLQDLERNVQVLHESVMRVRMLPISFTFNRFPRMVRDLSRQLDKKIELEVRGEGTELDKTVMEKIGDPLVHLLRNSLDHGIETPAERLAAGKPETGNVLLVASHQGGNVVIEISDDGRGLPKDKIRAKAEANGLVAPGDTLSDDQIHDLIFQPGFSTAETVSDVSGRGVGMDVVRKNILALGGSVSVSSEEGVGSTFTIQLPLTLAILDGQLVRVGKEIYVFPLVSIVESLSVKAKQISTVGESADLLKLRDDYIPIIPLYEAFGIQPDSRDIESSLVVVVESEGVKVGLVVDELLAQQQVVIKSLESNYKRVEGISGATILGDGTVSLILDIAGVVKMAERLNTDSKEAAA
ncbi:MAG: chemotaxis protein CheA [Pseudomonadales bacterium]